jgi:DNA primase
MGRIPEETILAIRDRVDIVDLVGRHVALKQVGRNFKGLCPFHDEKTPSFHVNRERQIFHCFGCGAGGNAITFLMRHENQTFPEVARSLARELGIDMPEAGDASEAGLTERVLAANARALAFYRAALDRPEAAAARRYLAGRGLDAEAIARFRIGFAPDRWDAIASDLRSAGIPSQVGERAGLVAERKSGGHYDRLRGRVVFPIEDARGRVIGFGGRALAADQEPKYLNTPESPVFHKREALYGLPDALEAIRRRGRVVVVEGYFDRIALARAGVEESVATCGTALTPEHARSLRRRAREVVLLFDADAAGERAVERALEILLPEGLRIRAALLPPGADPDSFLAAEGAEALRARVDQAPPALEILVQRAVARGARSPWEKADAVAVVVPLVARIPDPVERSETARQLALAVGADPAAVRDALRAAVRGEAVEAESLAPVPVRRGGPEERQLRSLLHLLLDHPGLLERLDPHEIGELVPEGAFARLLLAVLGAITRDGQADVVGLCEELAPEEAGLLRALVTDDRGLLPEPEATRALADVLHWLRRRRLRERKRQTTNRFLEPEADRPALLAEKQREIDESRALRDTCR